MSRYVVADGFSSIKIVNHIQEVFEVSEEKQKYLETFVKEQTRRAGETGGLFFDGDLIAANLSSINPNGNVIELETQLIKYSQHTGLFRQDPNSLVQALYANLIAITTDGKIVFGTTQTTEPQFMGKLNLPAGGLTLSPDGYPSLGSQIEREIAQEIGFISGLHNDENGIVPGWINGMSSREGNYHLVVSFVTPLTLDEKQVSEWFNGIKDLSERLGVKTEFKNLRFLPNDSEYLREYIAEQDKKGKEANLLGKSCDAIEEWSGRYECDIKKLSRSKSEGCKVYLPQPEIF